MSKKNEIQRKIASFCKKIETELEQEKILDQLELQGKTWNVVDLTGEKLSRGIITSANILNPQIEDQRLFY